MNNLQKEESQPKEKQEMVQLIIHLIGYQIAMNRRAKKSDNTMMQYYIVIGAFVAICVAAVLYVLMNPKKSFSQIQVINESQILVHNGHQFQFQ